MVIADFSLILARQNPSPGIVNEAGIARHPAFAGSLCEGFRTHQGDILPLGQRAAAT
ncbi:hypothetical protein PZ895_11490 [Mesorhizobium sp. YIM 152430]|uniref:hypothetical protein n=1 Tax=Mesorhizobium sp. YIM 152430 TaxID=3031761 RepID=UPI0023DAC661|nr:hypothetical protein [Mesorhizobium sp. YIM 152430]MDF1600382.1 hypothetical protein [Mesorhizobium sp. YIM 152430]